MPTIDSREVKVPYGGWRTRANEREIVRVIADMGRDGWVLTNRSENTPPLLNWMPSVNWYTSLLFQKYT